MDPDGIPSRVAVLENRADDLRDDLRELRSKDIGRLEKKIDKLADTVTAGGQGFTRAEKLTLGLVGIAAGSMVIAAIALIQSAPG